MFFSFHRRSWINQDLGYGKDARGKQNCDSKILVEEDSCHGNRCPPSKAPTSYGGGSRGNEDENERQAKEEEENIRNDSNCKLSDWYAVDEEDCKCENGQKQMRRDFIQNGNYCKKRYPNIDMTSMEPCPSDCSGDEAQKKKVI